MAFPCGSRTPGFKVTMTRAFMAFPEPMQDIRRTHKTATAAARLWSAFRSNGPVGWASRPQAVDISAAVPGAMPTRSALRVGKIAIDAAYACSYAERFCPPYGAPSEFQRDSEGPLAGSFTL